MADAELTLRCARRPLVLGMGGGGDVVGALATAELARVYDGAHPVVGGVTWERRAIDPVPGPRAIGEIVSGLQIASGVLLAGADTRVRDRELFFAESRMAQFLGEQTVLVDINDGPRAVARGLSEAVAYLRSDLVVFVDVGGDVLAQGGEPGLTSPLCDSIMLAAAERMRRAGQSVLLGVFGIGCDAELTPAEALERIARVAAQGGLAGARGLTDAVAKRLEGAIELVPTEASAQAVATFRGAWGSAEIRGGRRTVDRSPVAAVTYYLDVQATMRACGRLARAVADADSLEAANDALHELGISTELDLERRALASSRLA